jgi:hypothetical protein
MLAFGGVAGGEFPVLFRVVDAFEESTFLFLLGDVQEEFADDDAVAGEIGLGVANIFEAFFPDVFGQEFVRDFLVREEFGVDAHDKDVFVVAAVEDADVAAIGKNLEAAPELIVIEFL